MSFLTKKNLSPRNILGYTLPRLHTGKSWYVDFYAYDPTIDGLKRKKLMLDKYPKSERRYVASALIAEITTKLKGGWNPFINIDATRSYTKWEVVVQRYIDYLMVSGNKGILKQKTATDYRSRLDMFLSYLEESKAGIKYINQFSRPLVVDYLDYIVYDRELSARTRNNYRTWLSTFATWLVDRQYISDNFIDSIKLMKEQEKYRDALSADDLRRLKAHTRATCPPFYLACMVEYYTFIRPEELRHIKVGDISVTRQCITIPAEVSKNRREQSVALNDTLLREMIDQDIFSHPSQDYLFGKDLTPGSQQIAVNRF